MKVTILSGPYAGRTREVPPDISPTDFLFQLAEADWRWKVHWGVGAPTTEEFEWAHADIAARIIRALAHGRVVRFMGREYRAPRREDLARVAGEVEDAIVSCGFNVTVGVEDESGVTILVREP